MTGFELPERHREEELEVLNLPGVRRLVLHIFLAVFLSTRM